MSDPNLKPNDGVSTTDSANKPTVSQEKLTDSADKLTDSSSEPPSQSLKPFVNEEAMRIRRNSDQPTRSRATDNRHRTRKSNLGIKFFISLATLTFIIGMIVASLIYYAIISQPRENPSFDGTAIVANGYECADIGRSIIFKGGSSIDAAIAVMFCEGVANPESMGLGGGFIMIFYKRDRKFPIVLNARETAPRKAHRNMFDGNPEAALKGGLSVAVPGQLKGYYRAHIRYGKLDWSTLVQPTIDLCLKGHLVTPYFAHILKTHQDVILKEQSLKEIFVNPHTKMVYKMGDYIKRKRLARTLQIIAKRGDKALYAGELTKNFIKDIEQFKGIITAQDLRDYDIKWDRPVTLKFTKQKGKIFSSPLPTSGIILTFILNILDDFLDYSSINLIGNLHKIVESFKFAFAKRTELGDEDTAELRELFKNLVDFEFATKVREKINLSSTSQDPAYYGMNSSFTEDFGTANVAVLAPNGDAVCVTSTINQVFGARVRSRSTGIILNNQMDDFSIPNRSNEYGLPPAFRNYIAPGKRPVSSMCPSIVVNDNEEVVLIIGGAGGARIITSVAWVILKIIWYEETLINAIGSSRIHHQLIPMEIEFESNFPQILVNELKNIGHNIKYLQPETGFVSVTAIARFHNYLEVQFDPRRGGSTAIIT